MRVDISATPFAAAQPTPDAVVGSAPVQATAHVGAGIAPDAIAMSAATPATPVAKTPAATELDTVFHDVRAALKAGDGFPALVSGSEYAITPEGFTAPFDAIVKRAKEYGHKNPRDYAIGEVTVELGMKRFGYQRTDARLRNSAWNLLFTLLETVASARTMIARYPALEPQIKLYMTTKWTALANNTKQRSEPLSVFMLACISGSLQGNDVPMKGLSEKICEAITNGKEALTQLTVPADAATLAKLENDPHAADTFANDRLNQSMQLFFPPFRTLIEMELATAQAAAPKAEAASAATRKLVSAEDAAKQHQERIAKRETGQTPDSKLEQQASAAAGDFIETIRRYSGQDRFTALLARPTPSNVRAAIAALVDRGHKEPAPQIFDRTVTIILQTLLKSSGNRFGGVNDRSSSSAAWSAAYLRQLSGPDMGGVIAEPIQPAATQRLAQAFDMPVMPASKGPPPEAQEWLRQHSGRRRELDANAALGEELARFDGVTGEVGRLINGLRIEGADAYDQASRSVDEMNRGRWRDQAPAFEDAQARFRGVMHRHEQVQALLGVLDDESSFKKALRMNRGANNKELLAGAQRMAERQKSAREFLDGVFRNYGSAVTTLRNILEPRLSWYATAITNSATTRQSDPLLPLVDAGWLGVVTAELRRAELTALRIDNFVRSLPPEQAELIAPEYVGGRDALVRDMIEDVAGQLAEDLAGKSLDTVSAGNVASFKSHALPALAARPRLAFLCDEGKALELDVRDMNEVQRFVDVALLNTDNSAAYALDVAQKNQDSRAKAGRDDYSFWSRTFDLSAPSQVFLDELVGWRMYYARDLAQVVYNAQAADSGTDKVEDVLEGALAKADAATVSKATAAMTTALAAKDSATITGYLGARDAGIRDTARRALAKLGNITTAAVLEAQVTRDELGTPRLYAICDMVNTRDFARSATVLGTALGATDATTRAVVTFALAAIASNDLHASNTIAQQLLKLLTDSNPNIVQLASDALIQVLARGGEAVARDVVAITHDEVLTEPALIPLLTAIANNKKIAESIVVDAGREAERLRAYARQEGVSTPRRIATKRTQSVRKDVDIAALTLSAARGEHDIDAISDRVKLAMRLGSKFEEWSVRARETRPNTRMFLDKLDFADALIDDAVAELTGKTPRGFLAQTPELVTELMGSPSFSSSEVSLLATGRISERLAALAHHPLATSGQWRSVKLDALANAPDDLQAAVTLKLELSKDLPSIVGEIIATLLATTKSAIAKGVYKALTDTLGHPIPLLDPELTDAQRAEAVAAAAPLPPSVEALVERAVVDRLALVDPASPQAALFVAYLASGDRDAGDKRLTAAFEHAVSMPQADVLIATMRGRMKGRTLAPSASDSWVIALFKTEPQVTLAQLVAVRDSVSEARLASEATATAVAGDRVTTLANAIIGAHADIAPAVLSDLLGVVADAESDRDRQSILDGMKELVGAKQIEWTPSRASTLRRGLLMVAQNQRYAGGAAIEQTLSTVTRTLTAAPATPDIDLARILEIIARCTESLSRTSFGDALTRMIQAQPRGQLLSTNFLVDLDRWLASTEVGGSSSVQRHRDAIQRGIVELLPLADATMAQLVDSCMGLDEKRVSEILRTCAEHRRNAALTAEDVVKLATKTEGDAPAGEVDSFFGKLIGSKIGAALWKASSTPWADPLERKMGDSDEVMAAKRELARSLDFMNDAFAPQRRTLSAPVDMTRFLGRESYAGRGALGVYAATTRESGRDSDPATFKRFDYRAQVAGSRSLAQDARNRLLDGKSPVEQDIALTLDKARSISAAFDGSLGRTRKTRWRAAFEGPRLNVSRYVEQQIQRKAHEKRLEIAETEGRTIEGAGITRLPIYLAPVRAVGDDRQTKVLVNFIFDYSKSMDEDDRIVFMKRVAAMMLNACGMTRDLTIDSSLIVFSDDATMLIAPAPKHDKRTLVQALDPLKPYKSTALDRGLELAMTAGKEGFNGSKACTRVRLS